MEEGALPGGFGSAVIESLSDQDLLIPTLRIGIPDKLVDHATPQQSKEDLGLTPEKMSLSIRERFGWKKIESFVDSNKKNQIIQG